MTNPTFLSKGKQSVDEIPITNLVGYGAVVDVTKKASVNRDHLVTKTDFEDHEKKWGMIPEHTIILLNTGIYDQEVFFLNRHFPICCICIETEANPA